MKNILLIFLIVLVSSCTSYTRLQGNRVTHVLAITQTGDTVQVPMNQLRREFEPTYYNNWQFYWGNNWYWGNVWYPYYFSPYRHGYWNDWYWRRQPVMVYPTPNRVAPPRREHIPSRTTPRRVTPVTPSTPRREFSPQQPRVVPSQPRTPIREYNPSRGNYNRSPEIRQEPTRGGGVQRGGVIRQN
jgi:hypothetical protein